MYVKIKVSLLIINQLKLFSHLYECNVPVRKGAAPSHIYVYENVTLPLYKLIFIPITLCSSAIQKSSMVLQVSKSNLIFKCLNML